MVGLLANSGIPPLASGEIIEATGGIHEEVVGFLKRRPDGWRVVVYRSSGIRGRGYFQFNMDFLLCQ